MENDLRPVSLTCQIAKVTEGFTLSWILSSILDRIDSKQFAVAGKSTKQALVYMPLTPWIRETVLCGSLLLISVRDLTWSTTRFSCVNYLISTYTAAWLGGLPVVNRVYLSFFRLESSLSASEHLNGSILQGTRLDPILFVVLVNDLLPNWAPRVTICGWFNSNGNCTYEPHSRTFRRLHVVITISLIPKNVKSLPSTFFAKTTEIPDWSAPY